MLPSVRTSAQALEKAICFHTLTHYNLTVRIARMPSNGCYYWYDLGVWGSVDYGAC